LEIRKERERFRWWPSTTRFRQSSSTRATSSNGSCIFRQDDLDSAFDLRLPISPSSLLLNGNKELFNLPPLQQPHQFEPDHSGSSHVSNLTGEFTRSFNLLLDKLDIQTAFSTSTQYYNLLLTIYLAAKACLRGLTMIQTMGSTLQPALIPPASLAEDYDTWMASWKWWDSVNFSIHLTSTGS
jgi:hypothetical protein